MPADDKSHSMPQMVSKRCSIETTHFWWNVRILENWKIIITEICKISKPRGVTTRGNVSKSIYGHNFGGLANFHSTQKYFTICTQIIVPAYGHLRKNQHSIFFKKSFFRPSWFSCWILQTECLSVPYKMLYTMCPICLIWGENHH